MSLALGPWAVHTDRQPESLLELVYKRLPAGWVSASPAPTRPDRQTDRRRECRDDHELRIHSDLVLQKEIWGSRHHPREQIQLH